MHAFKWTICLSIFLNTIGMYSSANAEPETLSKKAYVRVLLRNGKSLEGMTKVKSLGGDGYLAMGLELTFSSGEKKLINYTPDQSKQTVQIDWDNVRSVEGAFGTARSDTFVLETEYPKSCIPKPIQTINYQDVRKLEFKYKVSNSEFSKLWKHYSRTANTKDCGAMVKCSSTVAYCVAFFNPGKENFQLVKNAMELYEGSIADPENEKEKAALEAKYVQVPEDFKPVASLIHQKQIEQKKGDFSQETQIYQQIEDAVVPFLQRWQVVGDVYPYTDDREWMYCPEPDPNNAKEFKSVCQ